MPMKRYVRAILCACAIALALNATAQPANPSVKMPVVVPPAPNAATLGKYGDIPVSLYTGTADISVPLYTIQSGDISIPLSLGYHTGGIRVNELAGWTGLGWALNAGGVVNRTLMDKDDIVTASTAIPELISKGKFPRGLYLMGTAWDHSMTTSTNDTFDYTNYMNTLDGFDTEYDLFNYNFLGKSGRFVRTRNGGFVIEKKEDIKIEAVSTTAVRIVDELGFIYKFEAIETATLNPLSGSYTTSWYLTEINSPKGNTVTFTYGSSSMPTVEQTMESESVGGFGGGNISTITRTSSFSVAKVLSRIDFDQGYVEFTQDNLRSDYIGQRITGLKVKKNISNEVVKEFEFTYGYFPGGTRMRLDAVTEKSGSTSLPPYRFSYINDINGSGSIPLTSKSIDAWGYFNNAPNSTLKPTYRGNIDYAILTPDPGGWFDKTANNIPYIKLVGADRSVNKITSSLFSLSSVQYPTGGKTVLELESNTYEYNNFEALRNPIYRDMDSILYFSTPGTTNGQLIFIGGRNVSPITSQVSFVFNNQASREAFRTGGYALGDMTFTFNGNSRDAFGGQVTCGGQVCTSYDLQAPPISSPLYSATLPTSPKWPIPGFMWTSFHIYWSEVAYNPDTNYGKYQFAGGLRVKTVTDYDGDGNIVKKKKYDYHNVQDANGDGIQETHSNGKLMAPPVFWNKSFVDYYSGNNNGQGQCPVFNRFGQSVVSPSATVGYDKVTEYVVDGSNVPNGKSEYFFSNEQDSIYSYEIPPNAIVDNINTYYGLPAGLKNCRLAGMSHLGHKMNGVKLNQIDYKKTGGSYVKVHEVTDTYSSTLMNNYYSLKSEVRTVALGTLAIYYIYPAIRQERVRQLTSVEKTYDQNDVAKFLTNTTTLGYSNNHEQVISKSVTNSKGETEIQNTVYAADFGTSLTPTVHGIKNLINIHAIAIPVEQYSILQDAGGTNSRVTGGVFTAFKTTVPLPDTVYAFESDVPIATSSYIVSNSNLATLRKDTRYQPKIVYNNYDIRGNPLRVSKIKDASILYIWGHNNTYPIAEVKYATDLTKIFFSGFEETGTVATTDPAHTGTRYLNSGSFNFTSDASFTPSPTTNLKMSYWYWSSNKWNYSGIVAFSNTISQGTRLDDIRVFPGGSFMTTYTYDPLKGVTSVTDANEIVSYYEYDSFNRLRSIKDDKGNVLKAVSYHYQD